MKTQDELLSRIAQTLPPDRGQEAFDLSMKIQDEADAAYAGGVVLSRWVENQPDKALWLVDQVLAFGPGSLQMQRFAEGWAAGGFPDFSNGCSRAARRIWPSISRTS